MASCTHFQTVYHLPLSHGACKRPASPAPSLPRHILIHAEGFAIGFVPSLIVATPIRTRCTTTQASDNTARQLAACRALRC
jgi:hypothetical protein